MSEDVWRKATHEHLANFAQSLIIATKTLTASGKAGLTVKHPLPAEKCRAGCIALATQFSQKVNALALAAKPPVYGEAGWKAIRVTATELEEVGSRLLFSANALSQSLLGQELRWAVLEIFEATQTLIAGLALATRNSSARLKIDRERLLSITGAIWSAAEHLNRTSMTENDSLKKTLADDLATLDDALIEARGLLDSADEYDEERVDEDSDEELLTELERRRVERALAILVLARRLVTRVIALLQRPRKPVGDPARIQVYVARLVADQDNLVSSLAGPQDVEELRGFAATFMQDARSLAEVATQIWPPDTARPNVDALIADLSIEDNDEPDDASVRSIPFQAIDDQLAEAGKTLAEL